MQTGVGRRRWYLEVTPVSERVADTATFLADYDWETLAVYLWRSFLMADSALGLVSYWDEDGPILKLLIPRPGSEGCAGCGASETSKSAPSPVTNRVVVATE